MGSACTTDNSAIGASVTTLSDDVKVTKILITGPSQAGKSYLLSFWMNGEKTKNNILQTQDFNMERIQSKTGNLYTMWEVSGKPNMRLKRRPFFYGTQGLIYVINNSKASTEFWNDASQDLQSLLKEKDLLDTPLLIVINKPLQSENVTVDEVKLKLNLPEVLKRKWCYTEVNYNNENDTEKVLTVLESLLTQVDVQKSTKHDRY